MIFQFFLNRFFRNLKDDLCTHRRQYTFWETSNYFFTFSKQVRAKIWIGHSCGWSVVFQGLQTHRTHQRSCLVDKSLNWNIDFLRKMQCFVTLKQSYEQIGNIRIIIPQLGHYLRPLSRLNTFYNTSQYIKIARVQEFFRLYFSHMQSDIFSNIGYIIFIQDLLYYDITLITSLLGTNKVINIFLVDYRMSHHIIICCITQDV